MEPLTRLATQHGFKLLKVSADSRWHWLYGSYMLVDADSNVIVHSGLDADDVLDLLTGVTSAS